MTSAPGSKVGAVLLFAATHLVGQGVLVAPHSVYIDHAHRTAALTLYNPNPEPTEVTISTEFGYPVTDSLGRFTLHTADAPDSTERSAAGWIQAYPRRLLVAPLERQTIRLLASPPAGLRDGEYWARLIISARGGRVPVASSDTGAVRVQLDLIVNTNIPLAYRKGVMTTGVALTGLMGRVVGDSVEASAHLVRQGVAAYVGTVHATLIDSAGRERGSLMAPIAVYVSMDPRFRFAASVAPGWYRLRVEVTTQRDDLDPAVVLRAPTVRDSVEVHVP